MISHQCLVCPWDCPSPETAPCSETAPSPMAPEPCDFPDGPTPSTGLDEELLRTKTLVNHKIRSYRNVLHDLSDWEDS